MGSLITLSADYPRFNSIDTITGEACWMDIAMQRKSHSLAQKAELARIREGGSRSRCRNYCPVRKHSRMRGATLYLDIYETFTNAPQRSDNHHCSHTYRSSTTRHTPDKGNAGIDTGQQG